MKMHRKCAINYHLSKKSTYIGGLKTNDFPCFAQMQTKRGDFTNGNLVY